MVWTPTGFLDLFLADLSDELEEDDREGDSEMMSCLVTSSLISFLRRLVNLFIGWNS